MGVKSETFTADQYSKGRKKKDPTSLLPPNGIWALREGVESESIMAAKKPSELTVGSRLQRRVNSANASRTHFCTMSQYVLDPDLHGFGLIGTGFAAIYCRVVNTKISRTFGGSFSAVWTAPIARVGAFCRFFQIVHDDATETQEFADLRTNFQNLVKIFYIFLRKFKIKFCKISLNLHNSVFFSAQISWIFSAILQNAVLNARDLFEIDEMADFSEISENAGRKNMQKFK